jgi:hypothetical protein
MMEMNSQSAVGTAEAVDKAIALASTVSSDVKTVATDTQAAVVVAKQDVVQAKTFWQKIKAFFVKIFGLCK